MNKMLGKLLIKYFLSLKSENLISLAILILMVPIISRGQVKEKEDIRFENKLSWEEVLNKAKNENKYIFIDVYATWCGPCKMMDNIVYRDSEVVKVVNKDFISVKLQLDTSKNDNDYIKDWYKEAHEIIHTFQITNFPTFLFFSPSGKAVHKGFGFMRPKDFITLTQSARNPQIQYYTNLEQFNEGKLSAPQIRTFAKLAMQLEDRKIAYKAASNYMDFLFKLNRQDLITKENLLFLCAFVHKTNEKGFQVFLEDSTKINYILGSNISQRKIIETIIEDDINTYIATQKTPNWDRLENNETGKFGKLGKIAVLEQKLKESAKVGDWGLFGDAYKRYFELAGSLSAIEENNASWTIFEKITDSTLLEDAAQNMKKTYCVSNVIDVVAWDTYANLLYKIGRKDEAIVWETKCVNTEELTALGNKGEVDPVYRETLEKMQKGQPTWDSK